MRAVITRVKSASVEINGRTEGFINGGLLVLLGIKVTDNQKDAEKLASKITELRIFEDENGKMNRSLSDFCGSLLVVSQFTLYGNCKRGRRPEFLDAARPDVALPLYELFIARCRQKGFQVQTGIFGADMQVVSVNDGPVTLILDTDCL